MFQLDKKYLFFAALFSLLILPAFSACSFNPSSKSTEAFLSEIPSLNANLSSCPVPLDSNTKTILGSNQNVQLTVLRGASSQIPILFTITNGALSGVARTSTKNGYEITMKECQLDSILSASDRAGAFAYLFTKNDITVKPKGIWNFLAFNVAKVFAGGALKKIATPITPSCSAFKADGEICNHGGECKSGNCVGEGQGPPWTYKCSCDPFSYKTSCSAPAAPKTNAQGKKLPGEVCNHGGECKSGNCVGEGQGPPWTYKCSCNAFKYVSTGC